MDSNGGALYTVTIITVPASPDKKKVQLPFGLSRPKDGFQEIQAVVKFSVSVPPPFSDGFGQNGGTSGGFGAFLEMKSGGMGNVLKLLAGPSRF